MPDIFLEYLLARNDHDYHDGINFLDWYNLGAYRNDQPLNVNCLNFHLNTDQISVNRFAAHIWMDHLHRPSHRFQYIYLFHTVNLIGLLQMSSRTRWTDVALQSSNQFNPMIRTSCQRLKLLTTCWTNLSLINKIRLPHTISKKQNQECRIED